MNILNKEITVFEGFSKVVEHICIRDFLSTVKKFDCPKIKRIREYNRKGLKSEADAIKKRLRAVTFAATFNEKRKLEFIESYNSLMILDFDNLGDKLEEVIAAVKNCPYTLASFLSPKGNGYKVLVHAASSIETHQQDYIEVASYYQEITNAELDLSSKDITRLCFYSHDPNLYINEDVIIFEPRNSNIFRNSNILNMQYAEMLRNEQQHIAISSNKEQQQESINRNNHHYEIAINCNREQQRVATNSNSSSRAQKQASDIRLKNIYAFEKAVEITNRTLCYQEGSRNNFIFHLACNCNRIGMSKEETIHHTLNKFYDLEDNEIIATVNSAYNSNAYEFDIRSNNQSNYKQQMAIYLGNMLFCQTLL